MEGSFGSLHASDVADVIAVLLMIGALVAGIAAGALLRRSGTGWRIGRLLAAAPERTVGQAVEMASRGDGGYVRISGRVGSDEEFPDEHDNPLVFRRVRLQQDDGARGWRTFDDRRDAVPFWLEERGARVDIDVDALAEGLVVVPRLSEGSASELEPGMHPALDGIAPDTRIRLRVEQVSAVDHATAGGVVERGADGSTRMTAGLRRPLILTPLEPAVAMRVLASERRSSVLVSTCLLVVGGAAAIVAVIAFAAGI